jgi:uncharacterized protein YceH (UPF0502 family)
MSHGAPSWVHEREQTYRNMAHIDSEKRLQDRIGELEKENAELKRKIAKMENVIIIALDLLTRKH